MGSIALVMSACQRREVLIEGMTVRLDIISAVPEGGREPELYNVYFYPVDGSRAFTDFVGPQGGLMHIPAGDYNYFVYNFDLEATILGGIDRYNTIKAYTSEASAGSRRTCCRRFLFHHWLQADDQWRTGS